MSKVKRTQKISPDDLQKSRLCFRISDYSVWTDSEWKFSRGDSQLNTRLSWSFALPRGELSTDSKYVTLLESFREVVWGMLTVDHGYGKILKIGSVPIMNVAMRDLFRWLALNGCTSLADLTESVQEKYLQDLPNILSDRNSFFHLDERNNKRYQKASLKVSPEKFIKTWSLDNDDLIEQEESEDEESLEPEEKTIEDDFGYSQVFMRINFIIYIYHQTEALNERRLPSLPKIPFQGESASFISRKLAVEYRNRIPPLPDEISIRLLSAASEWVVYKSIDALALTNLYWNTLARADYQNAGSTKKYDILGRNLREFVFSTLPGQDRPWREPFSKEEQSSNPFNGTASVGTIPVVRHIINRTADACYLTLLYLVGLRPSELCAVEAGDIGQDGLPTCIETKINKSGLLKLYFLRSALSKGLPRPTQETWLLGCTPADSAELPMTVKAVLVLYQLFAPWRKFSGNAYLGLVFSNSYGFPKEPSQVRNIYGLYLLKSTRWFIFQEVKLTDIPSISAHGENLEKYKISQGMCITPYQGRKTFSAFMLELRTSLLEPVRRHFKHLNASMTESAYFPTVHRLRQEQDSFATAESIRYFSEIISGKQVYGKMSENIKSSGDVIAYKGLPRSEVETYISKAVRTHDLRIFFSDHGNCFIRLSPSESRCANIGLNSSWSINSPDYAVRTPSLCAGCSCFVMDKSHIPFWRKRANALSDEMSTSNADNRVIKARAIQAFKILKILRTLDDEKE
ncbi:hypothetical protein [Acidovorax sp.]|uniref:hypothetical protein n=1 Tax=Acidovorax sp. TaxID=1872122 RepID=UPI004037BF79